MPSSVPIFGRSTAHAAACILPHAVASAVQISYNAGEVCHAHAVTKLSAGSLMSTLPEFTPNEGGTTRVSGPPAWTNIPESGVPARLGEFEIVSKLGEGSFGQVFLARQGSLGRHVALKVIHGEIAGRSEGQLLAGLEHDHIVKVFSAFDDPATGMHGLCLQYVPGADLGVIIRHVYSGGKVPASGRALLAALDASRRGEAGFDPAALRDREALASDDFAQAVCRIGGRLAEALAFAHAHGILHCDIKPANVLLTPYGRPMLADFNVAFDRTRHTPEDTRYGGTLAYMAPEYRAAMMNQPGGQADERCDVYSLGVALYELATGTRPAPVRPSVADADTAIPSSIPIVGRSTARAAAGAPGAASPEVDALSCVPRELGAVIRRALEPDPAQRYQSAAELAVALSGAWHLLAARRALPPPGRIGRWATTHPALALALAGILPHAVASVVQIGYNAVEIQLNAAQQHAFLMMVVAYNLVAYPLCFGTGLYLMRRVAQGLARVATLPGAAVDQLRWRVLRLGWQEAALGTIGWLPGAVAFPVAIDAVAGPLPLNTYAHFAVSFTLAGLIGVVFSYLAIEYVVFRALLPHVGNPDAHTPAKAWDEVRPLIAPFGPLVVLACGVPLAGAVLLLSFGGADMSLGFRLLVVKLIGLGVVGVGLAERVVRRLRQLVAVWQKEG